MRVGSFDASSGGGLARSVEALSDRRAELLAAARVEGLLGRKDKAIGGRLPSPLIEAAKARSGIQSDSELLLYALSKVALEDDFGAKLLTRKGKVPKGLKLDV